MQAATIKLFLADGKPQGIRTAEISNWTGKAIAGPRSELAELLNREELVSPGVYFLTGVDPETDQPSLYTGEAESVFKRLKHHRDRDDWSQAAVFVSKDENLYVHGRKTLCNFMCREARFFCLFIEQCLESTNFRCFRLVNGMCYGIKFIGI